MKNTYDLKEEQGQYLQIEKKKSWFNQSLNFKY